MYLQFDKAFVLAVTYPSVVTRKSVQQIFKCDLLQGVEFCASNLLIFFSSVDKRINTIFILLLSLPPIII